MTVVMILSTTEVLAMDLAVRGIHRGRRTFSSKTKPYFLHVHFLLSTPARTLRKEELVQLVRELLLVRSTA